jgi:hypothetical protein
MEMSMGPIANMAAGWLQSIFNPASRNAAPASTVSTNSTGAAGSQPASGNLSPFAQILNELQQLQQYKSGQYQQVTQQISTNLQTAAQTAQSNGNENAASELNSLAADFTSASQNGQLPSVQDLANAIGGGRHHHHHMHAAPSGTSSGATVSNGGTAATTASSANSPGEILSQLLAPAQSGGLPNASADPSSIILNTLSSAGIGGR